MKYIIGMWREMTRCCAISNTGSPDGTDIKRRMLANPLFTRAPLHTVLRQTLSYAGHPNFLIRLGSFVMSMTLRSRGGA
jgi:hypothetical protein